MPRPTTWPRAFFTDGVIVYDNAVDLAQLAARSSGPLAAVNAADAEAIDAVGDLVRSQTAWVPARHYSMSANTTGFEVDAPGKGVAVLTETYIPEHFRVWLNGQRVPYFRVNHAFKGVVIPHAGTWRVRVQYRPPSWSLAWAGAGVGLAMLVTLICIGVRPTRARL